MHNSSAGVDQRAQIRRRVRRPMGRRARRVRRALVAARVRARDAAASSRPCWSLVSLDAPQPRDGRHRDRAHAHGVVIAVRSALSVTRRAQGVLGARAGARRRVARRSRRRRWPTAGRRARAVNRNNFDLEDQPTPPGQNQPLCTWVGVSPGFFKAVGMRLERGRLFDEHVIDPAALVVDRAWANRFFPGEEVVGRRLASGGCTSCPPMVVSGVVSDVKWRGLEASPDGTVYYHVSTCPERILRSPHRRRAVVTRARARSRTEGDRSEPRRSRTSRPASELVANSLVTPRYLTVLRRHVRADGARALGRRHLRRHGAFRSAAHAGHRDSPGAWRRSRPRCGGS